MRHLHARASLPWLCLGDFNELFASDEKNGGNRRLMAPMVEFRHTFLHCGLVDMGFSGYCFTWRNGWQGVAFVEERLDRVVATTKWREIFPRTKVSHLSVSYSDQTLLCWTWHHPLNLGDDDTKSSSLKRNVAHIDCESIIQESWN